MRNAYQTAIAAVTLTVVSAASSADRLREASGQQQGIEQPAAEAPSTVGVASPPSAIGTYGHVLWSSTSAASSASAAASSLSIGTCCTSVRSAMDAVASP